MSKLQKVSFKTKNNNQQAASHSQPLIVDLTFLSSISKKYCCVLCHSLLREACQVTCCKTSYCRDCVERLGTTSGKCSGCAGKGYTVVTNGTAVEDLRRKVQQLKVHCINEGCKWTGSIEQLERTHLGSPRYDERDTGACRYQEVPCPNECGTHIQRLDVREHRFTECEKEVGVCEFCGMEMCYSQVHIHQRMCPVVPVECPNKCLMVGVAREDILRHLDEECPLRLVSCDYRDVGCGDKFQFRDRKAHGIQWYQKHLDLTSERLVFVGNENRELHSENDRLQSEITVLLSKLKDFQLGLETADGILDYYTVMNSVHDGDSTSVSVPSPYVKPVTGYYTIEGVDGLSADPRTGYYTIEGADGPSSSADPRTTGYYTVEGADDTAGGYGSATVPPTPAPRNAVGPAKRRERSKSLFVIPPPPPAPPPEAEAEAIKYQNIRRRVSEAIAIPEEVDETNIYESIDNIVDTTATADSRNPALYPSPKEASVPLPEVPLIRPRLRSVPTGKVPLGSRSSGSGTSSVPLPEASGSVQLQSSLSEPGYINKRRSSYMSTSVPLPEDSTTINKPWERPPALAPSISISEESSGVYSVPRNNSAAAIHPVPSKSKPVRRFSTSSKDLNPRSSPIPIPSSGPIRTSPIPSPIPSPIAGDPRPPETMPTVKPRRRVTFSQPSKAGQGNQDTPEDRRSSAPSTINSKRPTGQGESQGTDNQDIPEHNRTQSVTSTIINSKRPTGQGESQGTDNQDIPEHNRRQSVTSTIINSKRPTGQGESQGTDNQDIPEHNRRQSVTSTISSKQSTGPASLSRPHVDSEPDLNQIYHVIDETKWTKKQKKKKKEKKPEGVPLSNPGSIYESSSSLSSSASDTVLFTSGMTEVPSTSGTTEVPSTSGTTEVPSTSGTTEVLSTSGTTEVLSTSGTTEVLPHGEGVLIDFTDADDGGYQTFKMMKGIGRAVSADPLPGTTGTTTGTTSGQQAVASTGGGATGGSGEDHQESRSSTSMYPIPYSILSTGVPRQRSQTMVDGGEVKDARFVNRKLVDAVMAGSEIPSSAHPDRHVHDIPPLLPPSLPPKNGPNCETAEVETPKIMEKQKSASLMDLLAGFDVPTTTQNAIPLPPKLIQVPIMTVSKAPDIGTNFVLDPESQDTTSSKIGPKSDAKNVSKPSVLPKPGSSKPTVKPKPGFKLSTMPKSGPKPAKMQKPSSTLPRLSTGSSKSNSSPRGGGSDEMKQKLERIFSKN